MMIGTSVRARKRAAHVEPAQAWQHEIEHDQIRPSLGGDGERVGTGRGHVHLIAGVPQVKRDGFLRARVVVDDEDSGSHRDA